MSTFSRQTPRALSRAADGTQTINHEHRAFGTTNAQSPRLPISTADLETDSGFGFRQQAVPVSRAGRHAVVDIQVSFRYRLQILPDEYPDVQRVISDTLAFLQNYPEERAYWEIYARDAAAKLFKDYGVFSSLTVTLVIHPNELRPYLRTATATVSN